MAAVKYSEIIADRLSKAGLSLGWTSVVGSEGRTIWIVDAQPGDRKQFIVRADEKLSAFVELERDVLTVTFISNPFKPIRASEPDSLRQALGPASFSPLVATEVALPS